MKIKNTLEKSNKLFYCDYINVFDGIVNLSGWFLTLNALEKIELYIDNKFISPLNIKENRRDVILQNPQYCQREDCGFTLSSRIRLNYSLNGFHLFTFKIYEHLSQIEEITYLINIENHKGFDRELALDASSERFELNVEFGSLAKLIEIESLSNNVKQGETFHFGLKWKFFTSNFKEHIIAYYIYNEDNNLITHFDSTYFSSFGSFAQVREGDEITDQIAIFIPMDMKPGKYKLTTFVYPFEGYELSENNPRIINRNQLLLTEFDVVSGNELKRFDDFLVEKKIKEENLPKYDVLYFTIIDWDTLYQRCQHLASGFAANGHRVFYISVTFKLIDKYVFRQIKDNIFEITLPYFQNTAIYKEDLTQNLNLLIPAFDMLFDDFSIKESVAFVDFPSWYPIVDYLKNKYDTKVVFDCLDEFSGFSGVHPDIEIFQDRIIEIADSCAVTSKRLHEMISAKHDKIEVVPNATEFEHFNKKTLKTDDAFIYYEDFFGRWQINWYDENELFLGSTCKSFKMDNGKNIYSSPIFDNEIYKNAVKGIVCLNSDDEKHVLVHSLKVFGYEDFFNDEEITNKEHTIIKEKFDEPLSVSVSIPDFRAIKNLHSAYKIELELEKTFIKPVIIKRPIVGYYGAIAEWFDTDIIEHIAKTRSDWNIVLIGSTFGSDVDRVKGLPNVFLLGQKPYADLPGYLSYFDVCLIPFKMVDLIKSTNPVKFFEFLSAGKPVIARDLPELRPYSDLFYLANTPQEYVEQIEMALKEDNPSIVEKRIETAKKNDWSARYNKLLRMFDATFPKVSVILITYNHREYTEMCVDSILQKTAYPNYEIVIVDNDSIDDSKEYLKYLEQRVEKVKIFWNKKNFGFAKANNIGIEQSEGDYIILLNIDTIVSRGWIGSMVRHLKNKKFGLVGPITNNIGNESRINVTYNNLDYMESFAENYIKAHFNKFTDIKTLAMFCLGMRRETAKEIGLLDERFGIGSYEDDDYSLRARLAGYRTVCLEDVFIHHWGGASMGKLGEGVYDGIMQENRKKYEEKWRRLWIPHNNRQGVNGLPPKIDYEYKSMFEIFRKEKNE